LKGCRQSRGKSSWGMKTSGLHTPDTTHAHMRRPAAVARPQKKKRATGQRASDARGWLPRCTLRAFACLQARARSDVCAAVAVPSPTASTLLPVPHAPPPHCGASSGAHGPLTTRISHTHTHRHTHTHTQTHTHTTLLARMPTTSYSPTVESGKPACTTFGLARVTYSVLRGMHHATTGQARCLAPCMRATHTGARGN
jgi:hypothetical protein